MEHTHFRRLPAPEPDPGELLAAFEAGIAAVCRITAPLDPAGWAAQTPCPEWRAFELAGHLRCVADDLHEYLDAAPVSRYARLMGTGAHPDSLNRKLARQNAAELAALADAPPDEHIEAFAASARRYATRLPAIWDLPHHQYRDIVVTVGGMAGAACAEWHLHASDLAAATGTGYRPADPDVILAGWAAGMPHLPVAAPGGRLAAWHSRHADPWHAVLAASGRSADLASASRGAGLASSDRRASLASSDRRASVPSADREPGGDRSWARWTARPLLRRKG
ncbi:MAG TPA: maleylpyruvate isomerase N-terminal domain-containing protein [Streptosporangiaceae bacterium]